MGARTLLELGELAGPRSFGLASRLLGGLARGGTVPISLVISNVPGPPFPLYLAGARLVALHPLGPIFDDCGLNLTVISYLDHVDFGFIACRELIPDLEQLAAAVPEALAEIVKAAG